jgi:hypothetical protein
MAASSSGLWLWQPFEGVDVVGSDDREVRAIKGEDLADAEALRDGADAGIGGAEEQMRVALDEFRGALKVVGLRGHEVEYATGHRAQERRSAAVVTRVERSSKAP